LKVVVISNDFRVYWKGRLLFLEPYLAKHGISLQVIELFGQGSPYAFDKYNSRYDWWTCLFPNESAHQLTPKVIANGLFGALDSAMPDIVIASPITFFAGALSLRWAKHQKKKFIMFDDAKPLVQFKRNFLVKWVRNALTRQADALWLPTKDYDSEYPALKNYDVELFYGFNCVDNSLFKAAGPKSFNHKIIICVARLVPIKNIAGLLQAWQIVEKKRSGYFLHIVGDGPELDQLGKQRAKLKLGNVNFLGAVANKDLPEHFNKADAFILPSFSETWGLVVNEAMAAGLPTLLSNKINAAQSLLIDNVNGYSFDPFDVQDIANALSKYIDLQADTKLAMSARSFELINVMDYENMGDELLKALPNILTTKFKKPNFVVNALINLWYGKHDISAWDKL
jgi:glycosyltransferase involved in cell wall biosynthesis